MIIVNIKSPPQIGRSSAPKWSIFKVEDWHCVSPLNKIFINARFCCVAGQKMCDFTKCFNLGLQNFVDVSSAQKFLVVHTRA